MAPVQGRSNIPCIWLYFLFLFGGLNVYIAQYKLAAASDKRIYQDGDVILGALFPAHHKSKLETQKCGEIWEQYGIQRIEAFLLVLEQINNDPDLLPNVTLGCDIRDSCWYTPKALEESKDFIRRSFFGAEGLECKGINSTKPVAVVIGPGSSSVTEDVQNMLAQFQIPEVGYSATSITLSNTELYPYYLRVVSPDSEQARALADLVDHFKWRYVSTVHSEGPYGSKGIQQFKTEITSMGICVAAEVVVDSTPTDKELDDVITQLWENKKATVVICFCDGIHVRMLLEALKRRGLHNHFTVIGSDGWNTRDDVVKNQDEVAKGSFSIQLASPPYEPFEKHYLSLNPFSYTTNPWLRELWQHKFNCSFSNTSKMLSLCTGDEDLSKDLKVDGKIGFVVDATYTVAHGLHNMINNYCPNKTLCNALVPLNGTLFYEYMMKVNFTTYSNKRLYFNKDGDPPGKYQVMNYQLFPNQSYGYVQIATWDQGTLAVQGNIQWKNESISTPTSVCSEPCRKGYATHHRSGISKCCWICEKCQENSIIAKDQKCYNCEKGLWPNENLTECLQIEVKYIQWTDIDAWLPLVCALVGIVPAFGALFVIIKFNGTPVVKASTPELSYLILIGILLAYISSIVFILKPSTTTCYITRILPGLSFSMIYGSVLTKTNRIARILARGKKRIITKRPHCMTTNSLVAITLLLIAMESAIIVAVLIWQPAATEVIYPTLSTARLECKVTIYGILGPLGFDFFLIGLCTFYAINTRNVPENFNEAKFIGFTMYVTCVIWIAFVPLYFGSNSKIITITLCITLSATVPLVLLYLPKVYIILWRPNKNVRSAFTTSEIRCHVGMEVGRDAYSNNNSVRYSSRLNDEFLREVERYGLMKSLSKQTTDTEGNPGFGSRLMSTCDNCTACERPSTEFNNNRGKDTHDKSCQVDFDRVSMLSQPMWEISSEESCLSHGCIKCIHGDDDASLFRPPSYRSLCIHSNKNIRTRHNYNVGNTHRRCASLKQHPTDAKIRLSRNKSLDPPIKMTKHFEFEQIQPDRIQPVSSKVEASTGNNRETNERNGTSHSNPHLLADSRKEVPQTPKITCVCPARKSSTVSSKDDKNSAENSQKSNERHESMSHGNLRPLSDSRNELPQTAMTAYVCPVRKTFPVEAKLSRDRKHSNRRKLYPNCDSPAVGKRLVENGYIPFSQTSPVQTRGATKRRITNNRKPNSSDNSLNLPDSKPLNAESASDSSIDDILTFQSKEISDNEFP